MRAMVLVLESNPQAADLISFALSRAGYYIIRADNGNDGMRLLKTRRPDVALVDLPEGMDPDGFDVCYWAKQEGLDTSMIIFTKEDEVDLALSFEIEHIIKPFPIHELLECINLTALRTEQIQSPMIQTLGNITIDSRRAMVSKDDVAIDLTLQDYELFCYLAAQPDCVVTREQIMIDVWGYKDYLGDVRLVDVAIRRLRMKIENDPSNPEVILTRRGIGYLVADPSTKSNQEN